MTRQIALLRGVNVGGHRRVAMADLRALLGSRGYGDVRTLLQSGNVVLSAAAAPRELACELEREIAGALGVQTQVIVRTQAELAAVVALDPLREVAEDDRRYQVSFLSAAPEPAVLAELAAVDVAPERFVHAGREIYAWHPHSIQRSALAKLLTDRRLGVTATARNWNTVRKLLELARAE
ncbi:MAG TPA: DUF1697 domain-containing protein [Solirubrobacteraceae bacterium]|jgi:uncharacterized protein (DUF1697 family)